MKKIAGFSLLGTLLAACGVAGFLFYKQCTYYKEHFFPGTSISGFDCSELTKDEVMNLLRGKCQTYSMDVYGRGGEILATIGATDVNMQFAVEAPVEGLLLAQKTWQWFRYRWFHETVDAYPTIAASTAEGNVEAYLDESGFFDVTEEDYPRNAYIGEYEEAEDGGRYPLIPETLGNVLDRDSAEEIICQAVTSMQSAADVSDCYISAEITTENEKLVALWSDLNEMTSARIVYDWHGNEEIVDGNLIHNWISVEGSKVILDEEAVAEYMAEMVKKYNTYKVRRTFITTLGEEKELPCGDYGWKSDKEDETENLLAMLKEHAVTEYEPEYSHEGYARGESDIGDSFVEIDLGNQHLYLYIEGEIVLESDFVSGNVAVGNTTPEGVFGITYKKKDAVLRGRDYETPVNYWMPFNGNIGMHDATWRRKFGGDIYLTSGSHGCINLPLKKAEAIYEYMHKNFPVVCYY